LAYTWVNPGLLHLFDEYGLSVTYTKQNKNTHDYTIIYPFYCIKYTNESIAGCYATKYVPAARTYNVAFTLTYDTSSDYTYDSAPLLAFRNGSTNIAQIRGAGTGSNALTVYNYATAANIPINTGSYTLTRMRTQHIEIRYKPDRTNGEAKIWIDGILALDYTGDTGVALDITRIVFGPGRLGYNVLSNIIVSDEYEQIKETYVITLLPDGIETVNDWTVQGSLGIRTLEPITGNSTNAAANCR
jgi:hypothetical protein